LQEAQDAVCHPWQLQLFRKAQPPVSTAQHGANEALKH
jgi:hypothetical protein